MNAGFQWWCSASGTPWRWSWQAYPGVWLFIAVLAFGYWRLAYGTPERAAERTPQRAASAVAGLLLVWVALDWPVGALGGGYLASVHMVQYLVLALYAPPLLLYGLPPAAEAALAARPGLARAGRVLAHPVVAATIFVGVLFFTHAPRVTDTLMVTQAGSFLIDMLWLGSALLFWWPIVGHPPGRPPLAPPFKIGQIFLGTVWHTPLAMWMMLADFPLYATFELAPPIPELTPKMDQQVASGLMLLAGGLFVLGAVSVVFFRWHGMGEERPSAPVPARRPTA